MKLNLHPVQTKTRQEKPWQRKRRKAVEARRRGACPSPEHMLATNLDKDFSLVFMGKKGRNLWRGVRKRGRA